MDEIVSTLTRGPGLTAQGLQLAIGRSFRNQDLAYMVDIGRLKAVQGARVGIVRYYVASTARAETLVSVSAAQP